MPFNDNAMNAAAAALQELLIYAQLHSAGAGPDGTGNTAAARREVDWTVPAGIGDFGLASAITFTGGQPGGPVYSVTLWDDPSAGNFYGEFVLSGDDVFSSMGEYQVTMLDVFGVITEEEFVS